MARRLFPATMLFLVVYSIATTALLLRKEDRAVQNEQRGILSPMIGPNKVVSESLEVSDADGVQKESFKFRDDDPGTNGMSLEETAGFPASLSGLPKICQSTVDGIEDQVNQRIEAIRKFRELDPRLEEQLRHVIRAKESASYSNPPSEVTAAVEEKEKGLLGEELVSKLDAIDKAKQERQSQILGLHEAEATAALLTKEFGFSEKQYEQMVSTLSGDDFWSQKETSLAARKLGLTPEQEELGTRFFQVNREFADGELESWLEKKGGAVAMDIPLLDPTSPESDIDWNKVGELYADEKLRQILTPEQLVSYKRLRAEAVGELDASDSDAAG